MDKTFYQAVIFPFPKREVRLEIDARQWEGDFKTIYETDKAGTRLHVYSGEIAGAGSRKKKIAHRAETNIVVAAAAFQFLEGYHVPTHFIKKVSAREMAVFGSPVKIQATVPVRAATMTKPAMASEIRIPKSCRPYWTTSTPARRFT